MNKEQTTTLQKKLGQGGNSFEKYRRSVVGDNGYVQLFLYELIEFFCIPMKGEVGAFLRRWALTLVLGDIGQRLVFRANCTIRNGDRIFIGDQAVIEEDVTLALDVNSGDNKMLIGDRVHIGRRTILKCSGGIMDIGKGTDVGSFCRLSSLEGLSIGQNCVIGDFSCISAASHSFSKTDIPINQQPLTCKGRIVIGNFVTIGDRVTILDGVHVGDNVTILPDSLVKKNIASGMVVSGVPAHACQ